MKKILKNTVYPHFPVKQTPAVASIQRQLPLG